MLCIATSSEMPALAGEKERVPACQHEDAFSSSHAQLTECRSLQRPLIQEENWCSQRDDSLQNDTSEHRGAIVPHPSQREMSRL